MFVRVKQIYIDPNRGSSMHSMTGRERCDFTTKVNALQPRVLVSKVRKSASDLEMLPPISTATKPELHVESPLLQDSEAKATHSLKHVSGKTRVSPSSIRFVPPPSEVNVFLKSINATRLLHFQCI